MSDTMSNPSFFLYRESTMQGDSNADPTSAIQFYPSKDSDELFDALRAAYPHAKTHSERMRDAVIDFLVRERDNERVKTQIADTPSTWSWPSNSTSCSTLSSPDLIDLATPASAASPMPSMARQPSRASASRSSMDQMTGVFSLSTTSEPKTRVRRKMTESEKADYRKRRIAKACDKCSKRKRKCHHNQEKMETLASSDKVTKRKSSTSGPSHSRQPERTPPPSMAFSLDMDPLSFLTDDALLSLDDSTQQPAAADSSLSFTEFNFNQQTAHAGAWPWSEAQDWTLLSPQLQHHTVSMTPLFEDVAGLDDFSMPLLTRHQNSPMQGVLIEDLIDDMPQVATRACSAHSPLSLGSTPEPFNREPLESNGGGDALLTEGLPSEDANHNLGVQPTLSRRQYGGFLRSAFLGDAASDTAGTNSTTSVQTSGALDRRQTVQDGLLTANHASSVHQQSSSSGAESALIVSQEKGKAREVSTTDSEPVLVASKVKGKAREVVVSYGVETGSQSLRRNVLNGEWVVESSALSGTGLVVKAKGLEHLARSSATTGGVEGLTTGRLNKHDQTHVVGGVGGTLPELHRPSNLAPRRLVAFADVSVMSTSESAGPVRTHGHKSRSTSDGVEDRSPVLSDYSVPRDKSRTSLVAKERLQTSTLQVSSDNSPRVEVVATTSAATNPRPARRPLQTHATSASSSKSSRSPVPTLVSSAGRPLQVGTTAMKARPVEDSMPPPSFTEEAVSASVQNTSDQHHVLDGPSHVKDTYANERPFASTLPGVRSSHSEPSPVTAELTRSVSLASRAQSSAESHYSPELQTAAAATMAMTVLRSGMLLQLTRILTAGVLESLTAAETNAVVAEASRSGIVEERTRLVSCV